MAKDFSKLSDILNESVLTVNKESWRFGQAFDKSMSCCMLFKFWKNVAGKKFEKLSIPYELKGATLFVSVMSPAVIQELSFFKKELILCIWMFCLRVSHGTGAAMWVLGIDPSFSG